MNNNNFSTNINNCMTPHKPIFVNNENSSKLLEDPSIFSNFHLPSPFMHYEDEVVLFQDLQNLQFQHHHHTLMNHHDQDHDDDDDSSKKKNVPNNNKTVNNNNSEKIPKKKCSKNNYKKDRHSKINTAHGPRDRRMRLSLEIARKFFDLQDMLGFDKASKTVEWLLTNSHYAIKELARGLPPKAAGSFARSATTTSSTYSECEVGSGSVVDESAVTNDNQKVIKNEKKKKQKKAAARRVAVFHPRAKELRERARERARERTKEKKRQVLFSEEKAYIDHHHRETNIIRSWTAPPEQTATIVAFGEEVSGATLDCRGKNNNEMVKEVENQLISPHDAIVASAAGGNWSPSTLFNYQLNAGIYTGPQFMDFQFCNKS